MFKLIFSSLLLIAILAEAQQSKAALLPKISLDNLKGTFIQPRGILSKNYYFLVEEKRSWYSAKYFCEVLGWKLLAIENGDEYNELKGHIDYIKKQDNAFWTSGIDEQGTKDWRWGIKGNKIKEFHWAKNQRNPYGKCIRTEPKTFDWLQADCYDDEFYYICEAEIKLL